MAQTKSMMYDNPAYQAVLPLVLLHTSTSPNAGALTSIAGASTQSTKFVAFTNMLIKSLTSTASTVGTGTSTLFALSSNAPAFIRITNNGTTQVGTFTGTYQTLGAYVLPNGAAAITTGGITMNYAPQSGTFIGTNGASVEAVTGVNNWALINGGIPMKQGDIGYVVRGIDATEVILPWAVEIVLAPLGNVSP